MVKVIETKIVTIGGKKRKVKILEFGGKTKMATLRKYGDLGLTGARKIGANKYRKLVIVKTLKKGGKK